MENTKEIILKSVKIMAGQAFPYPPPPLPSKNWSIGLKVSGIRGVILITACIKLMNVFCNQIKILLRFPIKSALVILFCQFQRECILIFLTDHVWKNERLIEIIHNSASFLYKDSGWDELTCTRLSK